MSIILSSVPKQFRNTMWRMEYPQDKLAFSIFTATALSQYSQIVEGTLGAVSAHGTKAVRSRIWTFLHITRYVSSVWVHEMKHGGGHGSYLDSSVAKSCVKLCADELPLHVRSRFDIYIKELLGQGHHEPLVLQSKEEVQ